MKEIEIKYLKSRVESLQQICRILAFYAYYEAIYGMCNFLFAEECKQLSEDYSYTPDACTDILKGKP